MSGEFGEAHAGEAPTGEALFFMHALGLPLFLLGDGAPAALAARAARWASRPAATLPYLLLNVGACAACKRAFFSLLDASSALTATLAISVYRFIGILLSALVVSAPPYPPPTFWLGAALVLGGSIAYLGASASGGGGAGSARER